MTNGDHSFVLFAKASQRVMAIRFNYLYIITLDAILEKLEGGEVVVRGFIH